MCILGENTVKTCSTIIPQFLFDTGLITALDVRVKNGRTPAEPGEGLRMRSLGSGDFKRGVKANFNTYRLFKFSLS